ncbi:MAG: UDP-N-acetylmuramoyl-tripeptide--D-alanyl-D-alanine ligase [Sphingobacteriales bacterium]|nr:MAG: UDP-N-acetylmuramoyl-tripeptide--D-alanyl-D-alanine ligase [Sphingobacteriales bacterium]TAF78207.1 MAG: UDP-N-acetylmuramoyl-tripeptide--D-alanyl-D-alanine ligase [Sphingobacteriales bacterium]
MLIPELYNIFLKHPKVITDTRKITKGAIFFALKGDNFNGNSFASQALSEGASFAIIDEAQYAQNDNYILVNNVLSTLQQLASYHRQQLNFPVIGLTGSNGKTTTKELINSVLSQKFKTSATLGNLNNHIGIPLSLLSIPCDTQIAIIEMGANHQKEIEMLSNICQPTHGLITNVGKAHLEGFGGFEGVKKGKGELYNYLEKAGATVFINNDNPHLIEMMGNKVFKQTITYGTQANNFLQGELLSNNPFLKVKWQSASFTSSVQSHLTGSYNFDNLLVAIAMGVYFGLAADEINAGIQNYMPENNRSQILKTNKNTLISDYYNANPSSMLAAIQNLKELAAPKKIAILGDMFELGDATEAEHQHIIEAAMACNFDECIFIGVQFVNASKSAKAIFFNTTKQAQNYLQTNPLHDALILLKGSRGMQLETLVNYM